MEYKECDHDWKALGQTATPFNGSQVMVVSTIFCTRCGEIWAKTYKRNVDFLFEDEKKGGGK